MRGKCCDGNPYLSRPSPDLLTHIRVVPMTAPTELRVFISSTFRDLQEEREHLVKKIFPEIRALCRERGVTFTEVDLRWGLTEEDVVLGQVIRTCLEEIDRCRPYFIGITGERYGYVPEVTEYYKDAGLLRTYPWLEEAAIEQASIIDLEFRHAALNAPEDARSSSRFFFRRRRRGQDSGVDDGESARLDDLRARVRDAGMDSEEFRDPGHLGEAVRDALMEIIERDFSEATAPTPLQEERARHHAFAESRRHAYIPNTAYLRRLNEWLAADEGPLVIHAESGAGKSSLVSFWCEQLRRRQPELTVVEHYVGIGAGSSDHLAIMRHVIEEIRALTGRTDAIPSKSEELEAQFGNWLGFTLGRPIVIVVDGINQLTGHARDLHWLPPVMPPGVKLIITSTIEQTLVDLTGRGWQTLGVLPLNEREREALVVRFLAEYHKSLSAEQVRRIAGDAKSAHPLYLKTLLEELRLEARHETLERELARYLGATGTEDLFQLVLERMEEDYGPRTVRSVMSLLWCSRAGLDELELQELTGISRLKLSTMMGGLDYHLVRKDGVLTFFHDYLRRAVEHRYLAQEDSRLEHDTALAALFERSPSTRRSTRELLGALENLGERERLLATLADVSRFQLLWPGEERYEVLRLWSDVDLAQTGATILAGLDRWRASATSSPEAIDAALEQITELLVLLGCNADAEVVARDRIEGARAMSDRSRESSALSSLSEILWMAARLADAAEVAREAEVIARSIGDRNALVIALGRRSSADWGLGSYEVALAINTEREALARELGDRKSEALAIGDRGNIFMCRDEYVDGLECSQRHERIARELGDRQGIALAVGNQGVAYCGLGDHARAIESYAQQESIARELGDRRVRAFSFANRAVAHMHLGDFEESLICLAEQESIAREIGGNDLLGYALGNRGYALMTIGRFDEGWVSLAAAVRTHSAQGDQRACAYWLATAGKFLMDHPPSAVDDFPWPASVADAPPGMGIEQLSLLRTRGLAEDSLRTANELKLQFIRHRARILVARLECAEGNSAASKQALLALISEAVDETESTDGHYWLWKLSLDADGEHFNEAERGYAALLARAPSYDSRKRLDELRAATRT